MIDAPYYRAVRGAPAMILLILADKKRPVSLKELGILSGYSRETLIKAMSALGPDGLGLCAVSANKEDEQYISMRGLLL